MARSKVKIQMRNTRLAARFETLYNKDRLRLDDVIKKLADEFYLTERSVCHILSKQADEPKVEEKTGQTRLFE